jgi:hypothetical protein
MTFQPLPDVTLTGSTPGNAVGESIALVNAGPSGAVGPINTYFVLPSGYSGTIEIRVSANGYILTSTASQSFVQRFAVSRIAGVTVVSASDTVDQFGSSSASSWTFTVTAASSPDRLQMVFNTGSTQAVVNVTADVFITKAVQPTPFPLTPFKFIQDLYYDSVNNLMYVADVEQTTAVIPVLDGTTGATHAVINVPVSAGWTGSNRGAAAFAADANYVYALPSGQGSTVYILVIDKSTLNVVGYMNPLYGGVQYAVIFPDSAVATGGSLYTCVSDINIHPTSGANILQFNTAAAITAFPTAVTPVAANTDTYTGFNWNLRHMGYNSSTGHLWGGTADNISFFFGDYEVLFEVNASTLATVSSTQYNSANTYPTTYWVDYIFGHVMWSIGGNPNSPYQTFGGSTAQIFADGSPYITLPTSPAPYATTLITGRLDYDPIDNTMFVQINGPGLSTYQWVARYNSSATLVSTIYTGVTGQINAVKSSTAAGTLWAAAFQNSPFQSYINVYSHTVGSETLQYQITGF